MLTEMPSLRPGDTIAIVSPAKAIEPAHIEYAKAFFEKNGFQVVISAHAGGQHNYFSGSITERLADFQSALDDATIHAIVCARGGYGCIQLVNKIDWTGFQKKPKWIIGFSDVTVFHQKIQSLGLPSLHATMPLNFAKNSPESLETLLVSASNKPYTISCDAHHSNRSGQAEGTLVGGNISILFSLLGTDLAAFPNNCILFVEDLTEQLYHIDRMFHALSHAGVLDRLAGLIVGGMTNLKDTEIPYGQAVEEIILHHFERRDIPICFGFPAGHIDDNRALRFGTIVTLNVDQSATTLSL